MLLTDQVGVFPDWPNTDSGILRETTARALGERSFESGTMAPKVEAACRFVASTNARAAIGSLDEAREIIEGRAGTHVTPD